MDRLSVQVMTRFDQWSLLALLRFCLASTVALAHLNEYTPLGAWSIVPVSVSFEAVLGFLLISGYSVSASYLKQPRGFMLRRVHRLFPVYLVSLGIAIAVAVWVQKKGWPDVSVIVLNALFLNQLFTDTSLIPPAWSLSLEFWLYCLLPFLMRQEPRLTRQLVYLSLVAYVVYTALRTLAHLPYFAGLGYGGNLLCLSFIWICGLRFAHAGANRAEIFRDIATILAVHVATHAIIQLGYRIKRHTLESFLQVDAIGFGVQAVMLLVFYKAFQAAISGPHEGRRKSRLMQTLGDISYPLYLIHMPIYMALATTELRSPAVYYLISLAASYGVYALVDVYSQRRDVMTPGVAGKLA
jgi:peptidoglycan/LPS O-acetylase OafA/YrhL